MVAKVFPGYHPRAGQPTGFKEKILAGEKIHTIRGNYELWKARAEEINAGRAVLSLRQWRHKAYRSEQVEFMSLEELGVQKIERLSEQRKFFLNKYGKQKNYHPELELLLARNDGLSLEDFNDWFLKSFEGGILHFTDFRY